MTKKELATKMKEFIENLEDYCTHSAYASEKEIGEGFIERFAEFLNINLKEETK